MATKTRTRVTSDDVAAAIDAIPEEAGRNDARALVAMMTDATGEAPRMWGSIIGFGQYHYRYASGHEGDSALVGFAPRKGEFSIYLTGTYFPEQGNARQALLARLGRHRIGKACLYVRRLDDIDTGVLAELIDMSVSALRRAYPETL